MGTTAAWHPSSLSCPTFWSSSPSPSPSGDASRWSKNMNVRSFSDLEGCEVEAPKAQASSLFSLALTPTGVLIFERVLLTCRPRRSSPGTPSPSVWTLSSTLRNILGTRNLSEILAEREDIGDHMHK